MLGPPWQARAMLIRPLRVRVRVRARVRVRITVAGESHAHPGLAVVRVRPVAEGHAVVDLVRVQGSGEGQG